LPVARAWARVDLPQPVGVCGERERGEREREEA